MGTYYKEPQHEEYYQRYKAWIKEHGHRVTTYAVLDIIGNEDETFNMTRRMEDDGLTPLPVFHLTSKTWKYLDHYLEKYDYICIGGAVKTGGDMTAERRKVLFEKIYNRIRDLKPSIKIHALGITTPEFLKQYEVHSCDSVSWAMCAAYGGAQFFNKNTGKTIQLEFTDRKDDPQKENNLTDAEWQEVISKLDSYGLTVDKIRNDIPARRAVSLLYYQDMAEYLTDYYEKIRDQRKPKKSLF
jgi:hypothetical protein